MPDVKQIHFTEENMSKPTPLISVAMPVYNGEPYIAEAIECVLNQTYPNLELVISDNASTDQTEQICRTFAAKDHRIIYIRNATNIGAAKNYNQAFRRTSGPFFRWHNADDLCSPKLHAMCLLELVNNPDTVLSYGKTVIIDSQGEVIEPYDDNLDLRQDKPSDRFKAFFKQVGLTNVIYGLMRRSAVENTALMGDGAFFASDINFMAEMTLYGKFRELPATLFSRRMHVQASSWERKNDEVQQTFWQGHNHAFVLPNWKKDLAYIKAMYRAPIDFAEKGRLIGFLGRRMLMRRKKLMQDLVQQIYRLQAI